MCLSSLSLPGLYVSVVEVWKWEADGRFALPIALCFAATGEVTWGMFVWTASAWTQVDICWQDILKDGE